MLLAAGASVRGPTHADSGECNQDALGLWGWRHGQLAAVSDGLGSRPLSHLGSRLACRSVRQVLRGAASWDDPKGLVGQLYRHWMQSLPVAPSRASCTLLLAACRPDGDTLVAQLGDGVLAYRAGDRVGVLAPARSGFSNQTEALGISRSWGSWHVARLRLSIPGDALVLMTDGVADDLEPHRTDDFLQMVRRECAARSRRRARTWLRRQLEAWPTPGHADDKTIAVIYRR